MSAINEILDRAKKMLNVKSDRKLAIILKEKPNRISLYRRGKSTPEEDICFKLAETLAEKPDKIIAILRAEAEKNPQKKAFWNDVLSNNYT